MKIKIERILVREFLEDIRVAILIYFHKRKTEKILKRNIDDRISLDGWTDRWK